MVTSSALMGVFSGSRMSRSGLKVGSWSGPLGPPFQKVCDKLFCGIGPSEPATCSTSGSGEQAERAAEGVLDHRATGELRACRRPP